MRRLVDLSPLWPAGGLVRRTAPRSAVRGERATPQLDGDKSPAKAATGLRTPKLPHTVNPETGQVATRAVSYAISDFAFTKLRHGRQIRPKRPAGTFGYWPAGMKHFVWAKGETVVQIHGIGPWKIEYLNPADDPRKPR